MLDRRRLAMLGLVVVLAGIRAIVSRVTANHLDLPAGVAAALKSIEARTYPRKVHRGDPVQGRFGDVVATHASAMLQLHEERKKRGCAGFGMGAPSEASCTAFLDATRAELTTLLGATLREEGGLGPRGGAMATLAPSEATASLLTVCRRGALEVDALAAHGDGVGALRTCADTLAFARDVTLGGNTVEMVLMVTCVRDFAVPACQRALPSAVASEREKLALEMGIVRAGFPSARDIVRDDSAVGWLRQCGGLLDASTVASLSPLAQRTARELPRGGTTPAECRVGAAKVETLLEGIASPDSEKYETAFLSALKSMDTLAAMATR